MSGRANRGIDMDIDTLWGIVPHGQKGILPINQVPNRKLNRESLTGNKKPPITGG